MSVDNENPENKQVRSLRDEPQTTTETVKPAPAAASKSGSVEEMSKKLVALLKSSGEETIIPYIDYNNNTISYPVLKQIGVSETDVNFLEKLSSESGGIFTKENSEKQVICPKHKGELSMGIRLNCPHCNSMDINRLELIEHKVCGFIAEKSLYGVEEVIQVQKCPNCKKDIRDFKREIRMPGRWYKCNSCEKKFDQVKIQLHCRKYNHNFDIHQAKTITLASFKLRKGADESAEIQGLIASLKNVILSHGYSAEELVKIKGKSGVEHDLSLLGHDEAKGTIAIFVKYSKTMIEDSIMNSVLVTTLDISPDTSIFIGVPSISQTAKNIASSQGIDVITGTNYEAIVSDVEQLLSLSVTTSNVSTSEVPTSEVPTSPDAPRKIE